MADQSWTCRGLERLEQSLHAASSTQERRLILVRKACLFARLCRVGESRSLLLSVAAQQQSFEPRMSAWVLFCEGLIEHFESLGSQAIGKFRRAHAVSIATGDRELAALCSAWIANSELIAGNYAGVPGPLRQAFDFADVANSGALARACLVVADALSWSGAFEKAKVWYRRARGHAIDEGDISMQSVVFYNDVAFRIADLVLTDCHSSVSERDIRMSSMALDSVGNLDSGLGMQRLTSMVPLLRAEVFSVEGRWEEAVGLFDVFLADSSVHAHARLIPKFLAQRAHCKAMLGDQAGALRDVERAIVSSVACTDMDDLCVLHSRVSQVLNRAGKLDLARAHAQSADRCIQAYRQLQAQVQDTLTPVIDSISEHSGLAQKNPA